MDSGSESEHEKNINQQTTRMDNLPSEVALDILSRLPITSLIPFRFVSKSWQKLSFDPHLINLHRSRAVKSNTYRIFCCRYPSGNQLHFVEFSNHCDKKVMRKIELPFPTPMPKLYVVGSCNGLICISNSENNDDDVIHILNPFTRSYKQLPESRRFYHQRVLVGFGFHPLTNEFKVLRIVCYQDTEKYPGYNKCGLRYFYSYSEVQVYSMGSNDWRSIGKMPYEIQSWSSEPLLVNGGLHFVTRSNYDVRDYAMNIVSFDLADEQFREVPTPSWGGIRRHSFALAVLGGFLSTVVYSHHGNFDIWFMKEYGRVESWSKLFEIYINDSIPRDIGSIFYPFGVRVLCLGNTGGLFLMLDGALALYDPESRELKNVVFEGLPDSYDVIAHEGNLVWMENV